MLTRLTARYGSRVPRLLSGSGLVVAYIALVVFVAVADPRFFHGQNLKDMLVQNAGLALVVVGMAYVIIGGAYDLSVGGVAGFAGVLFAKISLHHSIILAGVAAVLVGLVCGIVNGVVVAKLRVNSFMATFATGLVFVGVALHFQGSEQISVDKSHFGAIGLAKWGPVPEPIVLMLAAFIVGGIILQQTRFGQTVYAVGGNREAARLVGIAVNRVWGATFVVSGVMAGVGGIIIASQLGVGSSDSGQTLPIEAIAAVVVGGISVYGGEGRMWRAALGMVLLATLNNVFVALSWTTQSQEVAEGVVILLALAANRVARAPIPPADDVVDSPTRDVADPPRLPQPTQPVAQANGRALTHNSKAST
jgi:ribose/xylose/arabinose/galactoside ABC-type transport system permease subunit